ncbi:MAG: hypothetical protein QOE80_3501 [Actinomycetota bacterium]|jgi:uncharacterized membrane protein YoaK (UPF0700 family)|nr:hypothetical protein [Actinomycetota bacterium]
MKRAPTSPDRSEDEDASLVPLLLALTLVAGAVDAVSILRLGHVFVGNMTGNVLFLGSAPAGSPELSVPAVLVALGAFLVGAAMGGRLPASTRRRRLGQVAAAEATLCAAAAVVAVVASGTTGTYTVTGLLAVAMGCQNATARALAVPDFTTTVLTSTLSGLAADRPDLSAPNSHLVRRVAAVAAMLAGALAGTLLVVHASTGWALATVSAILAAVAVSSRSRGRPSCPCPRG